MRIRCVLNMPSPEFQAVLNSRNEEIHGAIQPAMPQWGGFSSGNHHEWDDCCRWAWTASQFVVQLGIGVPGSISLPLRRARVLSNRAVRHWIGLPDWSIAIRWVFEQKKHWDILLQMVSTRISLASSTSRCLESGELLCSINELRNYAPHHVRLPNSIPQLFIERVFSV